MCAVITPSSNGAGTASKTLRGRQPQPATLVIFGAGGDLTKRLVGPALSLGQKIETVERIFRRSFVRRCAAI
jgi:hypothetical protein